MASLLALLSQQTPNLRTRKGLIILGLQNDFISPDGKLYVSTAGFLDRLKQIVPVFREFGDVIWVRSEFEANRIANVEEENSDTVIAGDAVPECEAPAEGHCNNCKANQDISAPMRRMKAAEADDDEELFLTRTAGREPCCVRNSWGAEHPADIKALIHAQDLQINKTYYSAFGSTSLLLTLRSRLITELYVCGCNTNLSVFATAMDAARYGIAITVIEDCLGYRVRERHEEAFRQLVDIMEAEVLTSQRVLQTLKNPELAEDYDSEEDDEEDDDEDEEAFTHRDVPTSACAPTDRLNDLLVADSDDDEDEEGEIDMIRVRLSYPARSPSSISAYPPCAHAYRQ
ncbi:hypothetical protein LTR08_003048 [Meristemomyces frigidus]|nr:hypothetical protein LTR08_003048 [Meristemomyces frigidus]